MVSDPFGVSGRAMLAALIAGERDPAVLAELAHGRMRSKTGRLTEALTGRFSEHDAFLLTQMLARVDAITADIATVQARIQSQLGELAPAVARLDAIPGVGAGRGADDPGRDRHRHEPVPHPCAPDLLARFAPGVSESAGHKKGDAGTGKGNRYLTRGVGEAAVSPARTSSERKVRNHVRELQALGYTVTLNPAA